MKPCVSNSPSSTEGNSGAPESPRKWERTGEKFVKETLKNSCLVETLLLRVPTQERGTRLLVHSDFCQLLQVSNCLSLGMISKLPKHLGLFTLSKDCSIEDVSKICKCVWNLYDYKLIKLPFQRTAIFRTNLWSLPSYILKSIKLMRVKELKKAWSPAQQRMHCNSLTWIWMQATVTLTPCKSSIRK